MNMTSQVYEAAAIVRRIERHQDIADELHQELYLSCEKRGDLNWAASQERLIVTIVKRLKARFYRRASVRKTSPIEAIAPEKFAIRCDPHLFDSELVELLLTALNTLPKKQRLAIELKYFEQKSDGESAIQLMTNILTLRKWRSRGIAELKRILSQNVLGIQQHPRNGK